MPALSSNGGQCREDERTSLLPREWVSLSCHWENGHILQVLVGAPLPFEGDLTTSLETLRPNLISLRPLQVDR